MVKIIIYHGYSKFTEFKVAEYYDLKRGGVEMARSVKGDKRFDEIALGETSKFVSKYDTPKSLRQLDNATIRRMRLKLWNLVGLLDFYSLVRERQSSGGGKSRKR